MFKLIQSFFFNQQKPRRTPTSDEMAILEQALENLIEAGIRLGAMYDGMTLREIAEEISTNSYLSKLVPEFDLNSTAFWWSLLSQTRESTGVDPLGLKLSDEDFFGFSNVTHLSDHCYDGATFDDYADIVGRVSSIADAWNIESIKVSDSKSSKNPNEYYGVVSIAIRSEPAMTPFELNGGKDFDWRLIDRLNERLPQSSAQRFAILHDGGGAIVVFLTPDEIQKLSALFGYQFETSVEGQY